MGDMKRLLGGARIDPKPVTPTTTVVDLIDGAFQAYNGARLREAVQLFTRHMLDDDVTVGVSVSGALTPAGLGMSCLIPLIEANRQSLSLLDRFDVREVRSSLAFNPELPS